MKRYLIPISILILSIASGLLIGCTNQTTTYYNSQFGYSVEMPDGWEVIEQPADSITLQVMDNTVGFRSELSSTADWVYVEVIPGKSASSAISEIHSVANTETRVYEYGKNGYVYEWRWLLGESRNWGIVYYIDYNERLYEISFNEEGTCNKVHVSIDGYGKVN